MINLIRKIVHHNLKPLIYLLKIPKRKNQIKTIKTKKNPGKKKKKKKVVKVSALYH